MTKKTDTRAHGQGDRLEFLDGLRAVAMLMVVGIHTTGYVSLDGAAEHWVNFVVYTISVPAFFLCDGYLLTHSARTKAPVRHTAYLAATSRRLLVPWAIFSALYTATRALFEACGVLEERVVVGQTVSSVLLRIYGSGIAPQLYFLLSLFLIRCGAPMWRRLAETPMATHLAIFVLYTAAFRWSAPELRQVFSTGTDPVMHALWGLQFYLAGSCLCRLAAVLEEGCCRRLALASTALLVTMLAGHSALQWILQYSYLLAAFFFFAGLRHTPRLLAAAGRDTMGIYLLHAPILVKACSMLVLSALSASFLSYLLVTLLVFTISWLATRVLVRLPYGPLLFGLFPSRSVRV